MIERRDFLRRMGGLAATWASGRLSWPVAALAGNDDKEVRIALLADAHLKNGDNHRPEALALARAVAEIRALKPTPHLVLFAGDLTHRGDPGALELGREILADLPAPLLAVRGEGDGDAVSAAPGPCLWGEPAFSYAAQGLHLIGLHTSWRPNGAGPVFLLGAQQRRWLAQELARLDPAVPLLILSHAPLAAIFRPWGQWTEDAHLLAPHLAPFRQVLCLHGHSHRPDALPGEEQDWAPGYGGPGLAFINRQGGRHQGLPATAWPLPLACQGTPAALGPGLGSGGCGWGLLAIRPHHLWQLRLRIWQDSLSTAEIM
jgi:Icc protein